MAFCYHIFCAQSITLYSPVAGLSPFPCAPGKATCCASRGAISDTLNCRGAAIGKTGKTEVLPRVGSYTKAKYSLSNVLRYIYSWSYLTKIPGGHPRTTTPCPSWYRMTYCPFFHLIISNFWAQQRVSFISEMGTCLHIGWVSVRDGFIFHNETNPCWLDLESWIQQWFMFSPSKVKLHHLIIPVRADFRFDIKYECEIISQQADFQLIISSKQRND